MPNIVMYQPTDSMFNGHSMSEQLGTEMKDELMPDTPIQIYNAATTFHLGTITPDAADEKFPEVTEVFNLDLMDAGEFLEDF